MPARSAPGEYVVREGETLYSIAFRYGLDYREVARWNGLGDGELIFPGQRLRLEPPAGRATTRGTAARAPATSESRRGAPPSSIARPDPAPDWRWPTAGRVVSGFGAPGSFGRGIGITGELGQPVNAAAAGRIVYTGSGLIGYGQLVIVKHNDTYLSAYGHTERVLVSEGDEVSAGERIATLGTGPDRKPLLHFEIRRDGQPIDPAPLLPGR